MGGWLTSVTASFAGIAGILALVQRNRSLNTYGCQLQSAERHSVAQHN
jgi:hypothetical protein